MRPVPALLLLAAILSAGCSREDVALIGGHTQSGYTVATGGDAARGAKLIGQFGCGSCHTIPGIHGANGVVGPPLYFFSRRTYIAGELPNSPANLVRWVLDPPAVEPKTAMPKLGLNEQQARDVAAYLYTLR